MLYWLSGVLLWSVLLFSSPSFGQVRKDRGFGTTTKTSNEPDHKPRDKDYKTRNLLEWIKNNPKKTLIGNGCFEEVTRAMGFEYLIQPKHHPSHKPELARLAHNFGVKFVLFFRNGPFWKFKLKKRRRECRELMGDYVG